MYNPIPNQIIVLYILLCLAIQSGKGTWPFLLESGRVSIVMLDSPEGILNTYNINKHHISIYKVCPPCLLHGTPTFAISNIQIMTCRDFRRFILSWVGLFPPQRSKGSHLAVSIQRFHAFLVFTVLVKNCHFPTNSETEFCRFIWIKIVLSCSNWSSLVTKSSDLVTIFTLLYINIHYNIVVVQTHLFLSIIYIYIRTQ